MTNKELYEIFIKLGMVEDESLTSSEFEQKIKNDSILLINFVKDLLLYNDLDTLKIF